MIHSITRKEGVMKRRPGIMTGFLCLLIGMSMVLPLGQAAEMTKDLAVKYILATAKAARTVYVKSVLATAKKGGVKPDEYWEKKDHAIMLPAQFVKAVGAKIKDFELTLVGLTPLYKSNKPKTTAEVRVMKELATGKKKVITFQDGSYFKGMSADFAIVQSCADCHNKHPNTTRKDWKKGDFMGAIIVRMKD